MLKIPFQFFWNIQNFVLSWKQSVWRKKRHVLGTFQFGPKSLYPELTGVAIFWLILSIFWNVENTLPILLKHSKFCSFMKTICLKKKKAYFGNFSIWTKIAVSGPYRCVNFLVDFEYLLKCWNYPSNSCETFKILFFHKNNQFEEKKACFGDFSIFGKIAVSGPYRCGLFLVDFEYFLKCWKYPSHLSETFKFSLKKKKHVFGTFQFSAKSLYPDITGMAIFWLISSLFLYVENTLPILGKHSKFCSNSSETFKICSLMKTISLKKKKHIFGTFQFSAKSLCQDLTGVAFFWLILSIFWNVENTLPILVKHSKFCSYIQIQFEEKNACFWDFSISTKIAVSGHYRCGHFLVDFEYLLKCWKYPSNSCETFKILFFHENNQFEEKKVMFWGLFNLDQNRSIRTLPVWPFFGWFWVFFEMLKIPFQFFWNIQNFVLSWKQSVWTKFWMFQKNWNKILNVSQELEGYFQQFKKYSKSTKKWRRRNVRIQRFCRKLKSPKNMPFFSSNRLCSWKNKILNVSEELEGYFQNFKKYSKSTKKRPRR